MSGEIAVVGCGIAGASVAYHLSRSTDRPVTVYERGAVGSATTARSTAVFRVMDDPVLAPMKRYGMELYNRFLAAPRSSAEFTMTGRLEAATGDEGAERLRDRQVRTGTYLDGDDIRETLLFPELDAEAVAGALYNPNAGYFRPVELTHEFLDRARDNGVTVRTNTEVTDVETDAGEVRALHTAEDAVPVSHVVAAAGPWNREVAAMAGLDLPVRHTLAPIVKLEPPADLPHTLPNLKHVETGYYVVGRADGTVLVGHSPGGYRDAGTEYDPDAVSDDVPEEILTGMTDAVGDLFPSLIDAETVEEWVGVRSLTPDGRPMAGPTAVDGFWATAFNSEGIQLAPAAGRVVASRIAGTDAPGYADDVSPARFDRETEVRG